MSDGSSYFQKKLSCDLYYSGANFEDISVQIRQVIQQESSVMILTGEAGAGKTKLCRNIVNNLKECTSVFFPETVKSFGEVVFRIAQSVVEIGDEEFSTEEGIQRIIDSFPDRSEPILLVFDQAEDFYLATLERIRRLFEQLCDAGSPVFLLFSGRPAFLENYKRLAICDFTEVPEFFFELPFLSLVETEKYLGYIFAQWREVDMTPGFFLDKTAIENIYRETSGNPGLIDRMLHQYLVQPENQPLPDFTESILEKKQNNIKLLSRLWKEMTSGVDLFWNQIKNFFSGDRRYHLYGVAVIIFAVLLFVNYGEPEKKREEKKAQIVTETERNVSIGPLVSEQRKKDGKTGLDNLEQLDPVEHVSAVNKKSLKTDIPALGAKKTEQVEQIEKTKTKQRPLDTEISALSEAGKEKEKVSLNSEFLEAPPVIIPQHSKLLVQGVEETDGINVESEQIVNEKNIAEQADIVALYPSNTKKYHIDKETALTDNLVTNTERLVQNRFVAGMSWRSGSKNQLYTLQIADFQGKNMKNGLNQLFSLPNYRGLVTDLYLFSKGMNPERIYVYYGEFESEELARKRLKSFSRQFPDFYPSVISIKDVMNNIQKK